MKALLKRLWAAINQPANKRATRVGVLDSGELILVDDTGRSQVLSASTTQAIRQVLDQEVLP